MPNNHDNLLKDLEVVRNISFVPSMLEIICDLTGMGFAAVARVTDTKWLACSVRDKVQFGLKEGEELQLETTLCNEIRDHRQPVIINNVAECSEYKNHHTPRIYGLQSYISFPIILSDGTFFGTLCAIDSKPAQVNTKKIIDTFSMFTELLTFHIQSQNLLQQSYLANTDLVQQNKVLTSANTDLDNIVHTASHDLKSPINNIESLVDILDQTILEEPLNRELTQDIIRLMRSSLKNFRQTLTDLTTIIEADHSLKVIEKEEINFLELVERVKQDLHSLILESQAKIQVTGCEKLLLHFPRKIFKSILYNLVSNAIKYRAPERQPEILINLEQVDEKISLLVIDNGSGIPANQQDSIFMLFKRLHTHVEGSGLGLYIVKKMVNTLGGQIKVESVLNQGTTFRITF
ncbi:GAF domain-containing sensor histidine kinase [Adhaeribacter swui]|uniref:histidine kinase n=1 Tax=Adhaeribacter swui TaxID=2086471 RepID=A0A7G7G516_9BACT|nr:GAF domain-containing sensor histidine kinase [Adhaeribacter swui]QNF32250.1 GAF domain-containing sensor histidine kinase [Adhaeribacter swui]